MRKSLFIILLAVPILFAADGPTNSVDAKDYVDPKLPAFDKRVWQNLLKYYTHARQIAASTLKEVECVQDFCWSSYRYLYSIERVANRAKLVWNNVSNFKAENPIDAIVYLEEDVFQKSDILFFNDIPQFKESRRNLARSRDVVRNRLAGNVQAINDLLPDGLKFQKDYLRLMEINSPDSRALEDTSDGEVNFHMAALAQASKQIASTDVSNEFSDNQSAILESTIKNAANDGTSDPLHQTEYSKVDEKNTYILSLQEDIQLAENIKTGAFFLMSNIKGHSNRLAAKQALYNSLEKFSDRLLQQKENAGK